MEVIHSAPCGRDGHSKSGQRGGGGQHFLYMEDGRICERGDHASLMAWGGRYARCSARRNVEQGYLELIKEAQA